MSQNARTAPDATEPAEMPSTGGTAGTSAASRLPAPPADPGAEADLVALGWAQARRGRLGRLVQRIRGRSARAWTAGLHRLSGGGKALGRVGLGRLAALGQADPARALRLVRLAPPGRFRAEAMALLVARSRGWDAAAPLFERLAADRAGHPGRAAALLRPCPPAPALLLAAPVRDRPTSIPPDVARRLVIYTACFGRVPDLPPLADPGGIRHVCFTDRPPDPAPPGWELLPADPGAAAVPLGATPDAAAPALLQAAHKIRAHAALAAAAPEAEWSLFLAPGTGLVGNLHTLVTRWLLPHDLALWRHPRAADWHDLAEHALLAGDPPGPVLAQARAAAASGLARDGGAADTGLLWRRHGAAPVRTLMEAWWRHEAAAPGADAISLYRAMHEAAPSDRSRAGTSRPGTPEPGPPVRPAILPAALGPAGDSLFAARAPRGSLPRRQADAPAAPGLARGRIPVAFLYAAAHARTATTFLRGEQLSAMVARAFPERLDVLYTHDAAAVRDQVVIVTKSALQTLEPDALDALRRRNLLAIGSWDDIVPKEDHVAALDAHMTLSIRQTLELNRLYPDRPAFLVTHHVNPQVRPGRPPTDRLRTAYFGDLLNTVRPDSISGMVDLVGINTARVNDSWLEALPHYNCHWIVRRPQPWNGWKPFLKAFVAARRGAAVIVTRDDGDALYYLGDDYPFYADSLEPTDLEMAMARVAGSFGGPDWTRALEIMTQIGARSTDAQVCAEFRSMIEALAA